MSTVTVLTSRGQLLTKVHKRLDDGTIQTKPYANASTFHAELLPFNDIRDLARIISGLSEEYYSCIIRGDPRDGADLSNMNRKLRPPTESDPREPDIVPSRDGKRWLKLDLDALPMPPSPGLDLDGERIVGVQDPATVVRAIIKEYLPAYFHGVSFYYSFSASAGVKPWSEVRLGLYYVLDRLIPDKALYRWAKALGVVDAAVFTPNQCNYTAAPLFFGGLEDPCAGWRSGLIEEVSGTVSIPHAAVAEPLPRPKNASRPLRVTDRSADRLRAYALAALNGEADDLKAMRGGTGRNNKLRDAAYSAAGFIPHDLLTAQEIEDTLMSAAEACNLVSDDGEDKTLDTLRRSIDAGAAAPRDLPPERLQGTISTTPPSGSDAGSADDAEPTVTFEEVLEWARAATISGLPRIFQDMRYLPDSQTRNAEREAIFDALKEATGVNKTALKRDFAASTPDQEQPERETLSQQLLNLILDAGVTLWRDPDGEPYISLTLDAHQEHHRLKTQAVKRWVQRLWYEETGGAIGREPLSEALGVLEGKAIHDGEEHETFIRVAELGEGAQTHIYIDMGDPHWHALEVTAEGWRVVDAAATPVRFIRSGGMLALPTPVPGAVADIAAALGIPHLDPEDETRPFRPFQASVAWLLQAFRVRGPFPILPLFGQQGAGKSTFTKRLCWLLDPHSATLRVLSRDDRDILIAARHSWLQAKDNVSTLSQWTSDAFCRLATGGAISTRTLYTDGEETILNAKRPLLLNGITNFLEQQDLVDRAIVASLPAIPEEDRLPESALEARYEEQRPRALGALLDVVATGIARSGERHLARLPRMADFAEWVVSCSPALGWDAEDFLNWYAGTKTDLIREALDASPIVPYLLRLADSNPGGFERSPSELLTELNDLAGLSEGRKRVPHGWPKRAQSLTNELKRLTPALLAAEGIEVVHGRDSRSKTWSFRNVGKSSASSAQQPWTIEKTRPARDSSNADDSRAHRHSSALIGITDADDADARKPSALRESRPARPSSDNADDADEIPALRGEPEKNMSGDLEAQLLKRADSLTDRYSRLSKEQLREKWRGAAASYSPPSDLTTAAKDDPLAATVALELASSDHATGAMQPISDYLEAARAATTGPDLDAPAETPLALPAGIPL